MKSKENKNNEEKIQSISNTDIQNFVPLYPQYDENNRIYVDRLVEAIQDDKILNIGLTGPYGAGKSSILSGFYPKLNKKNKYLTISLATLSNDKNNDKLLNNIEIGILQQLIYKVPASKIPFSKIPRIKDKLQIMCSIFVSLIIYVLGLDIIDKIFLFFGRITKWGFADCPIVDTIVHVSPIIIIFFAVKNILHLITISSISIKGIKLEENKENNESILNKNIDEILYFFKKTKYNVVIFEDIDRFNNVEIFYKLKEINKLLNDNSEIAKKGKIKFIYAVKDNILNNPEDRTKFFDIIIPVIPIISSTNAQEKFIEILKKIGMENMVSPKTIQDVSYFVKDMRLVTNICNEFKVFYEKVYKNIADSNTFSIDKLFVIVAYKNINPLDYNNMQYDNGQVNNLINFKEYIKIIRNNKIKENNKEIEIIKNQKIRDIEAIKKDIITKYEADSNYKNEEYFTKSNVFESINDFIKKADIEEIFEYGIRGNRYVNFQKIDEIKRNNDYREQYKEICNNTSKRVEEYEIENRKLTTDINNQKINILYKENEIFDSIRKQIENIEENEDKINALNDIVSNKCLLYFVRNGYIGEDYNYYINNIYLDNISLNDYIYIANVKNLENGNVNIKLENIDIVNSKLNNLDFENKSVLNLDLFEYLLENDKKEKYRVLKMCEQIYKQILDYTTSEYEPFFSLFFNITPNKEKFIKYMCSVGYDFWSKLNDKVDMSLHDEAIIGKYIIMYANDTDLGIILQDNDIQSILESDNLILQDFTKKELKKLNEVFNRKFRFKDISMANKVCINYIIDNDMYSINIINIEQILQRFNINSLDNPFTKLLNLNKNNMSKYLKKSADVFIEEITCKINTNVSNKEFINLLNCKPKDENVEKLLHRFSGKIENILEVEKYFWEKLLKDDRIVINLENIISIYKEYNITEELAEIINYNTTKISKEIKKLDKNEKETQYELIEFLGKLCYVDAIEKNNLIILLKSYKKFEIDNIDCSKIEETKIISLINNDLILFNENNYNNIKEYYPKNLANFCRANIKEFVKQCDNLDDDYDIINSLIYSKIPDKYKLILLEKKEYDIPIENSNEANIILELINKSKKTYDFEFDTLFYSVYNMSDNDDIKIDFIDNYFEKFSTDEIDNLIESLNDKNYRGISRLNSSRPTFDENDNVIKVLKKLKMIGYINLIYNNNKYKVTKRKLKK